MGQRVIQVDAFAEVPFAGNPAAVCVLPGPAPARWMQDVAREMNLSETAFLHREGGGLPLRWSPRGVGVALRGHARRPAPHVLGEDGPLTRGEPARFHPRSGLLSAVRQGEWIEMDLPAAPVEAPATPADFER